jgi:hypothetical protein
MAFRNDGVAANFETTSRDPISIPTIRARDKRTRQFQLPKMIASLFCCDRLRWKRGVANGFHDQGERVVRPK